MARITLKQWAKEEGLINEHGKIDKEAYVDRLGEFVYDSLCPVLCDECSEIEPDGHCEHGCPSVLLAAGMI